MFNDLESPASGVQGRSCRSRNNTAIPVMEPRIRENVHPCVPQGARSLVDKIQPGIWYMETKELDWFHKDILEEEMPVFADLLKKLLNLEPERRISAEEALGHVWFGLD